MSGAPGYLKNNNILLGTLKDWTAQYGDSLQDENNEPLKELVEYNLNGFALRGADNQGRCYFIDKPNQQVGEEYIQDVNPGFTSAFKASLDIGPNGKYKLYDDMSKLLYFDDPVLTFEDSMVYGCTLELTKLELKTFCENKLWLNLAIFQNFYTGLAKFGKYGNSNPHYPGDWEDIEVNDDQYWQSGGFLRNNCEFPSVHQVEVFYSKINTDLNPQFTIEKFRHRGVKDVNSWTFDQVDANMKQKFQAFTTIQSYERQDQELKTFTPSTPELISAQPRNILYPFIVYGDIDK